MDLKKKIIIVAGSTSSIGAVEILNYCLSSGVGCEVYAVDDPLLPGLLDSQSYSAIIYRIGPKSFRVYQNKLLPSLSSQDVITGIKRVMNAFDKTLSAGILSSNGIPMPETVVVDESTVLSDLELPLVLKVGVGNQGSGVFLVKSTEDLQERIAAILKTNSNCVVQEYIEESSGSDKRLFVVGGKVVTAMKRTSNSGDFRANLHLGGSAVKYIPTELEEEIAIRAARAHGLLLVGVDIIDSRRGPLVLEVNPSPGFAISKITGVDVVSELVAEITKE